jgi:serine/threonine-protein kinase RsbW
MGKPEMSGSFNGRPQAAKCRPGTGAVASNSLCVPARPAYLALIGMVVRWYGRQAGLSDEQCSELEVAVDEACTNVIRHAFPERNTGQITVVCSPLDAGLQVAVLDKGRPFDPEQARKTANEKRSRDLASGGIGLLLIRQLTDAVHYQRDEREGNCLTLIKYK